MSKFDTITRINRLINAGANRDYVAAVSAIWFLQASNNPNTSESQKLVPIILGTLESFFVDEAKAVDEDVYLFFAETIKRSEYRALFDEGQTIFDVGKKEISKNFSFGSVSVMEVYAHYANVMLETTKQQNKQRLLQILQLLAEKIDMMCTLANKAESDLF
ncbi:hypothetical protein Q7511_07400 [Glaesserella parasuis]|uniref:hypothetical protein n=1 Tax=Glaesserella parasuis TaxID=738 RepID=UPI00094FB43B|nr:hypothetical protein [Glaesserella parasuis]MCT8573610.1 hypothetical protein [Glaesserella parasuis]MCT8836652.1 hypothetical protein [Glaesserella parasuis]MDG6410465.1 hypothetical protein [Glaesserella parasuis]MDG6471910.1 hypothetical protein [Glaesserella parasuis]MDO9731697.1 hypothetical protein [Glaesserella parasuis]